MPGVPELLQAGDDSLFYLPDAKGHVRQGTDAAGEVVSAWRFDPDGTVLEGPHGPVSHLICGGVYDWSTGLIYRDGRYFNPALGLWLALLIHGGPCSGALHLGIPFPFK